MENVDLLKQKKDKQYNDLVKQVTPTHNVFINMGKAFIVGGFICLIGQALGNLYQYMGSSTDNARNWVLLTLIGASIILTGLNVYSKIAKFGGAGALVPITGFANSVAAPAIEHKKEGQIYGIGSKIFTIAGPVILFGIFTTWILGIIYYVINL